MIHIFLNPLSNNKKAAAVEGLLREMHTEQEVELQSVLEVKNIGELCSKYPEDDLIIIAGGDGTVTNFANEVYEYHLPQKILYYPCGSGNDFLNDVRDLTEMENGFVPMNKFLKSLPQVTINGEKRYFINGIGFGIDGYCCEEGDRVRARSDKKVNYSLIALKGLFGAFRPVNAVVTVDGVSNEYKKVWMAPAMIGRYYGGGMMIAPDQNRLNEEKTLSSVVFYRCSVLRTLSIFLTVFKGTHTKYKKYVLINKAHKVNVKFDRPCALQIDGETYLNITEYTVSYGE